MSPGLLYIHRYGDGARQPLILLHPGGMLHSVWLPMIRRWQDRYALCAPDLRPPASIPELAAQLTEQVVARCASPPWLIGASLGANVALQIAATATVPLAGLVLDSAQAGGPVPAALRRLVGLLSYAGLLMPARVIAALMMRVFRSYAAGDHAAIGAEIHSLGMRGILSHIAAHFTYDVHEHLRRVTAPTLLLAGARDRLTAAGEPHRLQALIPHATLEVVPDAGHVTFLTQLDHFHSSVTAFLDQ